MNRAGLLIGIGIACTSHALAGDLRQRSVVELPAEIASIIDTLVAQAQRDVPETRWFEEHMADAA